MPEATTDAKGLAPGMASPFDVHPGPRVIFGVGVVDRLGECASELGLKRVLIVTDQGVRATGYPDRGADSLRQAGVDVSIFDAVEENPSTRHVADCVAAAREFRADSLVGFGGGSSMDAAKGANFLLSNGGVMSDYWGIGKATKPMLPMIAVPTTAGTGSEAQSFALISDEKTHQKMACGDKKAMCKVALLDPAVTVTLPYQVTAIVGIDAVAHALETYVSNRRNGLSLAFSKSAWRMLFDNYEHVLERPRHLEARGAMLLGAHLAGSAIERSMLGAAHAAANPLTAHFGVTHGVAVGIMLPWVVRFNAETHARLYADLVGGPESTVGNRLAERLTILMKKAGLQTTLREAGLEESGISELAEEAVKQWTAAFNPRPVTVKDFETLYRSAF
jgi:alcohol dehydrogenase class IV